MRQVLLGKEGNCERGKLRNVKSLERRYKGIKSGDGFVWIHLIALQISGVERVSRA